MCFVKANARQCSVSCNFGNEILKTKKFKSFNLHAERMCACRGYM